MDIPGPLHPAGLLLPAVGRRALMGRALAAAALAGLGGCARAGAEGLELDAAVAAEMLRRPEFYTDGEARAFRVTRDGVERGVLWGTWHVGYDETTVLPRVVRGRFNSARLLLVEQVFDPRSVAFRNGLVRVMREATRRVSPAAVAGLGAATRDELRDAGIT